MTAIEILRAASRSVPNEDYVQFCEAVDGIAELIRKAHDLEICANTANACYSRNPGNFALALRELRDSAERTRDALANVGGA